MTHQVDHVMTLLDVGSGGVKYVGIYGMGGIGKTTLAMAVYNKLFTRFDGCSFVENIREESSRHGLECIRNQLLDRLDPSYRVGSSLYRDMNERFRGKKVLVVLDDIDKWEKIENLVGRYSSFGSGSRIIITTRNINVLRQQGQIDYHLVQEMEMTTLNDVEAIKIFSKHAFGTDSPPDEFRSLSQEAVSTTARLPLSLIVIGSHLRSRDEKVWKDVIARSRNIPPKEVKSRLKISYDDLEPDQQQIFLDIACFFVGSRIANPSYMWEACQLYPAFGIEVLRSMSMVKIKDDGEIWVHDQLRDLGRSIVREEFPDPRRRSRLWVQEEAFEVLTSREGKEMIEALSVHEPLDITLTRENFVSFHKIRFLELAGGRIEGNFSDLLGKLKWFSWHLCPSRFVTTNLQLKNLVILDLSHSSIDEKWGIWSLIQVANRLKVLDLKNCQNLTIMPEFTLNNTLERLVLSGCSNLRMIGSSIGNLRCLKYLELQDCHALNGLPDEIGSLEDLEEISVSGGGGTFRLPESIGNLKSLVSLKLENFQIKDIPTSLGGLVKLKYLSIIKCGGLMGIPTSVGTLRSLVELDLTGDSVISELPDTIGGLVRLKKLRLFACSNLKELPESLGKLESLVELDLQYTNVEFLPNSIGDLRQLKEIYLSECKVRKLPRSIGRMRNLEKLIANKCLSLTEVPEEIGELSNLSKLVLLRTSVATIPSTIIRLTRLQYLDLCGDALRELPELPSTLNVLCVSSNLLPNIPNLGELDNLVHLTLLDKHAANSDGIKNHFTRLKSLELGLTPSNALLPFDLSTSTQLESLYLGLVNCTESTPSTSSEFLHSPTDRYMNLPLPSLSNLRNLSRQAFCSYLMKGGFESLRVGN